VLLNNTFKTISNSPCCLKAIRNLIIIPSRPLQLKGSVFPLSLKHLPFGLAITATERTFSWLVANRRLARDYERLPETSEIFIYAAMCHLMLTRLTKN
jgi:hypothetical protein